MVEKLTRIDANLRSDAVSYGEHHSMAQPLIVVSQLSALRSERDLLVEQHDTVDRRRGRSRLLVFAAIIGAAMVWFALNMFAWAPTPNDKIWCAANPTDFWCPRIK